MASVQMEGLEELRRALRDLPDAVQKNVLADAVRQGADIIRDDARNRAPLLTQPDPRRKPGTLRNAVRASRGKRDSSMATVFVYIRVLTKKAVAKFKHAAALRGQRIAGTDNPDDPFYWRFVEFGTAKMPARPFLRPAFDTQKEKAAEAIKEGLRAGIEEQAAKVHGKLFG